MQRKYIVFIALAFVVGTVIPMGTVVTAFEGTKEGGELEGTPHVWIRMFTDDDPFGKCAWDVLGKDLCYHTVNYRHNISIEQKVDKLLELHGLELEAQIED